MDDVGVFRTTIEIQNWELRGPRRVLEELGIREQRKQAFEVADAMASRANIATRASRLSLLAPFQAEQALHREKEGEEARDAEAEEGPDEDERVGPVNRAGDASRRHQMDDRHAQRG